MSQSERTFTLFQEALIIQINKIKILISNLFYDERKKLNFFFVQMKLYIRKYRNEFRKIENQIIFASIYFEEDVFK